MKCKHDNITVYITHSHPARLVNGEVYYDADKPYGTFGCITEGCDFYTDDLREVQP